ncbi:hypothetical protein FRB95_003600 [Tulasnella sp. JGI-2019a]|nr:hypothetical protein FRB95_003600 [Tulasnella sp. JGI-2019a]
MADAGFFKGTSADQDSRFKDKDALLRKSIKFPPEFDTKVDVKKVALTVIRPWVVKRLEEKLGLEDEILVEYVMTKLEENRFPDPKAMQIEITGFLRAKTPEFMIELWKLLMSAQKSPGGVPIEFVEEKKQEMRAKQEADQKVMQEVSRRADLDRGNTGRLDEIRERERNERRGGGGGRGDFGVGRGDYGRGRGGGDRGGRGRARDNGWGGGGPPPRDGGWGGRGGGRGDYGPPRRGGDRNRSSISQTIPLLFKISTASTTQKIPLSVPFAFALALRFSF